MFFLGKISFHFEWIYLVIFVMLSMERSQYGSEPHKYHTIYGSLICSERSNILVVSNQQASELLHSYICTSTSWQSQTYERNNNERILNRAQVSFPLHLLLNTATRLCEPDLITYYTFPYAYTYTRTANAIWTFWHFICPLQFTYTLSTCQCMQCM